MAKIICKGKAAEFTGHIGAAHFVKGEAETDVPTLLAHFRRQPERFDVIDGEQGEDKPKRQRRQRKPKGEQDKGKPEQPAEGGDQPEQPEGEDKPEDADNDGE